MKAEIVKHVLGYYDGINKDNECSVIKLGEHTFDVWLNPKGQLNFTVYAKGTDRDTKDNLFLDIYVWESKKDITVGTL